MPIPAGWRQLSNVPEDEPSLQTALNLVMDTYPAGQYSHLNTDVLRRKMVCRYIQFKDNAQTDLVLALRVFVMDDPSVDNTMAIFYFGRHRGGQAPKDRAYCLTVGVGRNVSRGVITTQMGLMWDYMHGQKGGGVQVILDKVDPSTGSPPPEKYPVTNRLELNAAFKAGRETNNTITYKGIIKADTPPWPDDCHVWLLKNNP